ncbi:MAG: hypothetical protein CMP23_10410 [Rickettsiales bacterium]|nr:hypothetical protein [Rickettsiales bacterium]|tara:strand:+ start:1344 stop:1535 length:192 start_codon:yes stop_codon:yes gene_type:complete
MKLSSLIFASTLVASTTWLMIACGGTDPECTTDADCPDGQMCHIHDGGDSHCMAMGDDDDSAM